MTDISDVDISSPDAFRDALAAIIATATAKDVDIRGAWECHSAQTATNWEINISELARSVDDEDPDGEA